MKQRHSSIMSTDNIIRKALTVDREQLMALASHGIYNGSIYLYFAPRLEAFFQVIWFHKIMPKGFEYTERTWHCKCTKKSSWNWSSHHVSQNCARSTFATRAKLASRKMSWCCSCTLLTMQKQVANLTQWWHLPTALRTTALRTIYCTTLTRRASIQHEAKLESAVLASRPVQSAVNPTTYNTLWYVFAMHALFPVLYFME